MRALLLSVLLLTLVDARPNGKRMTVTVPCGHGELRLTFDLARISEEMVKPLADFAPEGTLASSLLIDPLELCVESNPEYKPCGKRNLTAPNFFANAEVNLKRGEKLVAELRSRQVPSELEPAKEYIVLGNAFRWEMERRRFQAAKSGNLQPLKEPLLAVIDPAKVCAPVIAKLEAATDALGRYRIAWYDWNNCVNNAFLDKQGEYPTAPWKNFLDAYGIKAKFIAAQGD